MSPTGRSVLLIGLGLVALGLFCSLEALLNVEARTVSSLMGEFQIDELTEDVVRLRGSGLFWHEQVHLVASPCTWSRKTIRDEDRALLLKNTL